MNTKVGQTLSILLLVVLILFWSASILAADNAEADAEVTQDVQETSVALAEDATAEAADEALESIAQDAKLELDLSLIGRSSLQVAAND